MDPCFRASILYGRMKEIRRMIEKTVNVFLFLMNVVGVFFHRFDLYRIFSDRIMFFCA